MKLSNIKELTEAERLNSVAQAINELDRLLDDTYNMLINDYGMDEAGAANSMVAKLKHMTANYEDRRHTSARSQRNPQ